MFCEVVTGYLLSLSSSLESEVWKTSEEKDSVYCRLLVRSLSKIL